MTTRVLSRGFLSLVAMLVAGAIFLPRSAVAATTPISALPVIDTGLEQSAFENLASCVLEDTFQFPPNGAAGELHIDVPDNKTAYWGANQPLIPFAESYKSVWFCDKQEVDATLVKGDKWYNPFAGVRSLTTAETTAVWAIGNLISLTATVAAWIIWLASQLLAPLLGVGSFITNPLVRSGWPFVQGIANLGFLLALLFIAFATTLQLDSFSVRKTLPRLLMAALLINFSLVITGLLIDVSRLVMAALLAILGNSLDDLAFNLLQSSRVVAINFDLQTFKSHGYAAFQGKTTSWQTVASTLQAAVLMWGLAAGFIILIVGLLMRYIMLILLLIVSPLAFLAVALPNTAQLANKWWSTFITYVLYGPVAVFILLLPLIASRGLASGNHSFTANVLNLFVVIAMMIAAAVAGKKLGVMGAGAAVDFVKNPRGMAMNALKNYGPGAAFLATGGVATAAAAAARTKTGKNVADSVAKGTGIKYISPQYWDQRKKELEKREKRRASESYGSERAQLDYATPAKRATLQREAEWTRDAKAVGRNPQAANAAFAPDRLQNTALQKALSSEQVNELTTNGSDQQFEIVVSSPEIIRKMDVQTPQLIVARIQNQLTAATAQRNTDLAGATTQDQRNAIESEFRDQRRRIEARQERFNRSYREAERRDREDSK